MLPPWLRRVLWRGAFGALAARVWRGLSRLDEPEPEPQPARWPPLIFEPDVESS